MNKRTIDFLDHMKIEEAKKDAEFVDWETVKAALDKKHGIKPKDTSKPEKVKAKQ